MKHVGTNSKVNESRSTSLNGRIEQVGTPAEVYHQPANGFVYDFLGNYNEFEGWKDEAGKE